MTDQENLDYFHMVCGKYFTKARVRKALVTTAGTLINKNVTSENFSEETIQEIVDEKRPSHRNALIIMAFKKANGST